MRAIPWSSTRSGRASRDEAAARAKAIALLMMWSSLVLAMWRYESLTVRLVLVAIGAGVSICQDNLTLKMQRFYLICIKMP